MKLTDEQIARVRSLEDAEGRIAPDAIIEDAKRKDSPLHGLFEWDKATAAMAWWKQTAREVIASVKLVVTTNKVDLSTVCYVRDPEKAGDEQGYRAVHALRADPEQARQALIDELTRAAGYVNRCRSLSVSLGLEADIDELMARIVGIQNTLQLAHAS